MEILPVVGKLPGIAAVEVLRELAEGVVEQCQAVEPVVALLRLETAEEVVAGVIVAVVVVNVGSELEIEVVVLVPLLFRRFLLFREQGGWKGSRAAVGAGIFSLLFQ